MNLDNEQKIICYFLKHPTKIGVIDHKWLIETINKMIYLAIRQINIDPDLVFDLNTIHTIIRSRDIDISFDLIQELFDSYDNFANMDFCFNQLKNDYLKFIANKEITENILAEAQQTGYVDPEKLEGMARKLIKNVEYLKGIESEPLQSLGELMAEHRDLIELRDQGINQRTTGYGSLDEKITKPFAPQQSTTIFALTGGGKSIYAKNFESRLISNATCVVSFNVEMPTASNMDFLLGIHYGIDIKSMQQKNMPARFKAKLEHSMNDLTQNPFYLYYGLEQLSLDKVDSLLYQAKEIFRDRGVLPEDDYMVVVFDLLSDLDDFSDEKNDTILLGVKYKDRIIKKHNVHSIDIVQANENKLRGGGRIFQNPSDLDHYRLGLEDIYGGAGYAKKSRVVMSLHRPNFMKIRLFPDHEEREFWEEEADIINVNGVKQTEGRLFFVRKELNQSNLRITTYQGSTNNH